VAKSTLDTDAASWPALKSAKSAPTAQAMVALPFGEMVYCPLSAARTTVAVTVLPEMEQDDDTTPVLSCQGARWEGGREGGGRSVTGSAGVRVAQGRQQGRFYSGGGDVGGRLLGPHEAAWHRNTVVNLPGVTPCTGVHRLERGWGSVGRETRYAHHPRGHGYSTHRHKAARGHGSQPVLTDSAGIPARCLLCAPAACSQ
jgi:hypothetical protein